jgi:hypothetical protein
MTVLWVKGLLENFLFLCVKRIAFHCEKDWKCVWDFIQHASGLLDVLLILSTLTTAFIKERPKAMVRGCAG